MRWDEAGAVPEDVEPTVLSYQEFLRRENLRAWYRRRRGMSQEVLAGLVGRTEDWLQRAENNRIQLDRLSVIRSLAPAAIVGHADDLQRLRNVLPLETIPFVAVTDEMARTDQLVYVVRAALRAAHQL